MKIIAFINVILLLTEAFLFTKHIVFAKEVLRSSDTAAMVLGWTMIFTFITSLITAFSIL